MSLFALYYVFPDNKLQKSFLSSIGRGGQSALRFARLRMEKRHNYVRKVAEVAVTLYISNDKPNIAGLILAGSADFKTELSQSDMFDPVSTLQGLVKYSCCYVRAVNAFLHYFKLMNYSESR